jgi:hypothetical protein
VTRAGFDLATGTLRTDLGESLGPDLTRAEFLAGPMASGAEVLVRNEPYVSWRIEREIGGRPFAVGIYFDGDRLTMVILALADPAFGSSWADWTAERELARKAAHDAWLGQIEPAIGDAREEAWGFVSSIVDDRSGGAEIVIRYGARLPERLPPSPFA